MGVVAGEDVHIAVAHEQGGSRVGVDLLHQGVQPSRVGLGGHARTAAAHSIKAPSTEIVVDDLSTKSVGLVGKHRALDAVCPQGVQQLRDACIGAFVFAASALPIFLFLKERSVPRLDAADREAVRSAASESFAELRRTLGSLGDFRDFAWLSVCGFLYQCGVSVVITLSAVYAAAVMGFKTEDTLLMVFLVNITAAVGAFAFGYVPFSDFSMREKCQILL